MKKIILILLLSLFLIGTAFAKYFDYVGKDIIILLHSQQTLRGVVENVIEIDICRQKDGFGNCVYSEYFYTLYVRTNEGIKVIDGNNIAEIKEIK